MLQVIINAKGHKLATNQLVFQVKKHFHFKLATLLALVFFPTALWKSLIWQKFSVT